jgi:iron complex outermembrane recepter protein
MGRRFSGRAYSLPFRTICRHYSPGLSGPGGIPDFVTVSGDPNFRSEDLLAYDLGYRIQPTSRLSLDITTYYNSYTHLRTSEQGMPVFELDPAPHVLVPITLENKPRGETYGVEFAANWNVTRWWRLSPGYSWLREGLRLDASSTDTGTVATARDNPNSQFQLRSLLNLPHRVELDSNLYFVGRLANQAVPAYSRFDIRLGWRPKESLEVSGVLQNAFQPLHQEFGNPGLGGEESLLRRSAYAKLVLRN